MANYVEVVAVRFCETGKLYLYQAPWYTRIEPGTSVLCEFDDGEALGTVVGSCPSVAKDSYELSLMMLLAGTTELKKIIAKYDRKDLEYDDDEMQ